MPTYDVRCPAGHEAEILARWDDRAVPCIVCDQPTERVWRPSSVVGDEWSGGGGRWIENLGDQPVYCQTKSDLQKEMDKRNLRHPDRYVPGDKHLSNWGAGIDAYTLESARVLLSRSVGAPGASEAAPVRCETLTLTVRDL